MNTPSLELIADPVVSSKLAGLRICGKMLKPFKPRIEAEAPATPHALHSEEMDLIYLLHRQTRLSA